jgi:hypothetical protein
MNFSHGKALLMVVKKVDCVLRALNVWLGPPLVIFSVALVLLPAHILMPEAGLDQSWSLAINQAVVQGLAFGRDIMWNFGPYAAIYTKYYHPALDGMIMLGEVYLVIMYSLAILLIFRPRHWYLQGLLLLTFCLFAPLLDQGQCLDVILFYYPLLTATYIVTTLLANHKRQPCPHSKWHYLLLLLLVSPLGFLPLIKVSLLALDLLTLIALILILLNHKAFCSALLLLFSPVVTLLIFWRLSGQSLTNLPDFCINSLRMIIAYTEGMGSTVIYGSAMVYFIVAAVVILGVAGKKISTQPLPVFNITRVLYLSICAAVFFLSFKEDFVRHGDYCTDVMLILAMLLVLALPGEIKPRTTVVFIIITIVWLGLMFYAPMLILPRGGINTLIKSVVVDASNIWESMAIRLWQPQQLVRGFNAAFSLINQAAPLPKLSGTSDIYSYGQAYLFASGNVWQPRPIIQSYQACAPQLITKNAQHLRNTNNPDNLFFKIEYIDDRFPALEDGASWPIIFSNYQPVSMLAKDYLLLKKQPSKLLIHSLGIQYYKFAELVILPKVASNTIVFAKITIKHSLLGSITNFLLKSQPLDITVDFLAQHKQSKSYLLIADMAKTGFVLSPLIDNSQEFAALYANPALLANKQIRSFTITVHHFYVKGDVYLLKWPDLWQPEYTVEFFALSRS